LKTRIGVVVVIARLPLGLAVAAIIATPSWLHWFEFVVTGMIVAAPVGLPHARRFNSAP
jgi:hypothetical protein